MPLCSAVILRVNMKKILCCEPFVRTGLKKCNTYPLGSLRPRNRIINLRFFSQDASDSEVTKVKGVDNIHKIGRISNVAYFLISNQINLDADQQSLDRSLSSMTEKEILLLDEKPPKKRQKKIESPYNVLHEIALSEEDTERNNYIFPLECEDEKLPESIFSYYNEWNREPEKKEKMVAELKMKLKFNTNEEPKSVDHILTVTGVIRLSTNAKKDPEKDGEIWKNLGNEIQPYLVDHLNKNHEDKILPEPSLLPKFSGYWKSMKAILPNFHKVEYVDFQTEHPFLKYTATADLICYYKNQLTLVSWKPFLGKASNHLLSSQPMKVMACVGALNFDPNFQMSITKGIVVIPYPSGAPAHILEFDEQGPWENWITKLCEFYTNNS